MEDFSAKALFARIHKQDLSESTLETYSRRPLQLIGIDESGHLSLNPECEQLIRQIPGHISIVSTCGPMKSGKSVLSNLLVSNTLTGFEVSSSPSIKTSGIWLWGEPIRTKDAHILFLDCQCTNFIESSSLSDMKLYSMIILLSSVILFNSKGVIDEESIKQLTLLLCFNDVIDFSQEYNNTQDDIESRVSLETPKFIWVLRDFQLAVLDDTGATLQAKEYMESVLGQPSFMGKNAANNARILQNFLRVFKDRECFTLPRPVDREKDLQRLEEMQYGDLRNKFRQEFEKMKVSVLEECPKKKINGSDVTGFQLITMVEQMIELLNEGETPNLYEVIDYATRVQYEEILHRAKEKFSLNKGIDLAQMPFEEFEIIDAMQRVKTECLDLFNLVKPGNQDIEIEMVESFLEFFQEDMKKMLKANFSASEAYNISLLETLNRDTIVKLDQKYYEGNFEQLESDWIKGMHLYEREARGPGKFTALSEFSRTHQHGAFNKFFDEINSKYFQEVQMLRVKNKDSEEKYNEQCIRQARQDIINNHITDLQEALNIDDNLLEDLLKKIEQEVGKKKKERNLEGAKSKKIGCTCSAF